jgi:predicted aldo/keto reductase-like oxidoreductase
VLPRWRRKVFVVGKWDPPLVTPTVTKATLLEALDVSLKKLNTTYIDCMMIHSIGHPRYGGIERIQNPAIYEAWDEAKRLGKIRFTGASSHGVRMIEEIGWGLDNRRFDVILVGANFLTHGLEPLLKKARSLGVATMAMKTMTIYKSDLNIRALQNQQTNARQAVIKWILASDLFDTMIVSMRNYDQVHEYLSVSGTTELSARDNGYLETLRASISEEYCRPGCGGCYGSCPRGVPVADVLRYRMYFEHYGEEKFAMQRYGLLPAASRASRCEGCEASCERRCPHGIRIQRRLLDAHRMLTMA